jgi:anti-sigma-K factor RskA
MSEPDHNPVPDGSEPPSDDVLAGEFVLGVLEPPEREQVQRRQESDATFAQRVADWERRLSPLALGIEPVDVPEYVWSRIRARLGWSEAQPRAYRPGFWQSLWLWRSATALAAAIAIAALLIGRPSVTPPSRAPTPAPVTTLARDDGTPGWLASVDTSRGTVLLVPVPSAPDAGGRVPELWLIPSGQSPRALGLLSTERSYELTVPTELRAALTSGSVLAVSLEPPGGAPNGAPTGPIVAKGAIRL